MQTVVIIIISNYLCVCHEVQFGVGFYNLNQIKC